MTQHYYPIEYQGKPATILMGWDRPLQGFFMVIESDGKESEEYIYSNLEDPDLDRFGGLPPCLDHFHAQLQSLGLTVPDTMVEALRLDAALNRGNLCIKYNRDGTVKLRED